MWGYKLRNAAFLEVGKGKVLGFFQEFLKEEVLLIFGCYIVDFQMVREYICIVLGYLVCGVFIVVIGSLYRDVLLFIMGDIWVRLYYENRSQWRGVVGVVCESRFR